MNFTKQDLLYVTFTPKQLQEKCNVKVSFFNSIKFTHSAYFVEKSATFRTSCTNKYVLLFFNNRMYYCILIHSTLDMSTIYKRRNPCMLRVPTQIRYAATLTRLLINGISSPFSGFGFRLIHSYYSYFSNLLTPSSYEVILG